MEMTRTRRWWKEPASKDRQTDRHTDRHTDTPTDRPKGAKGGGGNENGMVAVKTDKNALCRSAGSGNALMALARTLTPCFDCASLSFICSNAQGLPAAEHQTSVAPRNRAKAAHRHCTLPHGPVPILLPVT